MLSSILTPCGLFCVNSDRRFPWNLCQLFLFYFIFFSVLPTPLNSEIVGFYRIDAGRYMLEESPFIARSISRIPLLPGMCQVGIRHCWGMGKTDFPPTFSCPFLFEISNDDGDGYHTSPFQCCCWHESILQSSPEELKTMLTQNLAGQTMRLLGDWGTCGFTHRQIHINIPRDSPLAEERWSNICGTDEPLTKTKCRLSSTIRYHWQQKLESVRFSCASATSLSFPERKKSMFWLFPRFPVSSSQTLINMHNSYQQFTKPLTCDW